MISFAKGHGTENDFIILPDPDVLLDLSTEFVSQLCDRRAGIGADGVLRIARTGDLIARGVIAPIPGVQDEDWFMDYRNADGSVAEMCGNGVRVFAHWLYSRSLVQDSEFRVGTRAGVRPVTVHSASDTDAMVSVGMGTPVVTGISTCRVGDYAFAGLAVDMGNPHLACVVPELTQEQLALLPIEQSFEFDTDFFPHGVNIEVLTPLHEGQVSMRVHERGSGETRSCGTGTVAAARAALADQGIENGTIDVHVPGGKVSVTIDGDESTLTGPSKIIAVGELQF
ncbi:diaminopimelate epimerase [Corynebacterium freiburgense]|uniref:diaminopimelate epimerase n=1 Tax=Corynebacterium freiburgense TaxID=556548 RepID=UPI00040B4623|nr:diaminopimelate epimerase [Corynebacterium freiburgense]WJZ02902.1 Diaminopimelate epimerase [Corynebacterium freiburgense]